MRPLITPQNFYESIVPFSDFSQVLEDTHYLEAPKNWLILLTDVRGSTKAIQEGRYQQVNMIGAASITCVLNALGSYAIPFVFGGDGATLLIPPEAQSLVCDQLKGLQILAKEHFAIDLRVGLVPLSVLRENNLSLKIAKYELSPGNYLAQFRVGALSRAEEMIKNKNSEAILITANEKEKPPDLNGLSCRLDPIKSQQGEILSLLCKPRNALQTEETLQLILNELKSILGNDFRSASPVSPDRLSWKYIPPSLKDEVYTSRKNGENLILASIKVLLRILVANFSIKKNISMGGFNPEKYRQELVINSDFKKFDEMLRMVIDCTPSQASAIEQLLETQFKQKNIFFGIHKSSEALMTCMVFSASQNQHIHFIDGSDGGYALAALSLKKQIALETI